MKNTLLASVSLVASACFALSASAEQPKLHLASSKRVSKEDAKEDKAKTKDAGTEHKDDASAEKKKEEKNESDDSKADSAGKSDKSDKSESDSNSTGSKDSTVVAKVNGKELTMSDLKDSMGIFPPEIRELPFEQIYPQLLDNLVNMTLLTEAAKSKGLDKDPVVLKKIAECQTVMLHRQFLEQEAAKLATEPFLRQKFDELVKNAPKGGKEVKVSHILVESEAEAKSLLADLKKPGADFAEIAKNKSKDKSKERGGDLGYIRKNDMPKPFTDKVFSVPAGVLVEEPIRTDFGWHIARVEDKRDIELPKYEQVKAELKKLVSSELMMEVVKNIRNEAKVERFGIDGKPLPEKPKAASKTDGADDKTEKGADKEEAKESHKEQKKDESEHKDKSTTAHSADKK